MFARSEHFQERLVQDDVERLVIPVSGFTDFFGKLNAVNPGAPEICAVSVGLENKTFFGFPEAPNLSVAFGDIVLRQNLELEHFVLLFPFKRHAFSRLQHEVVLPFFLDDAFGDGAVCISGCSRFRCDGGIFCGDLTATGKLVVRLVCGELEQSG